MNAYTQTEPAMPPMIEQHTGHQEPCFNSGHGSRLGLVARTRRWLQQVASRLGHRSRGETNSTLVSNGAEAICVSLKALNRMAEDSHRSGRRLPEEVVSVAGLGWINGCVLDEENEDLILFGPHQTGRPSLHLDDLIVTVRNVWHGEVAPYCSLDPKPEDVLAVSRLFQAGRAASESDSGSSLVGKLKACWGPQTVVVSGVPKNSRPAHIMIEADHHMKRVSQGLVAVQGLESFLDAFLRVMELSVQKGKRANSSEGGMARFWFHVRDGEPKFAAAEGIVCVNKCSVVVLTEAQREGADGTLHDSGEDNPLAEAFAREFSDQFSRLAGLHPIYAELEQLFRLYALIRALQLTPGAAELLPSFRGLLEDEHLEQPRPMPPGMPGLVNAREKHLEVIRGNVTWQYILHAMVSGGVSMDMQVDRAATRPRRNRQLEQKRQLILRNRPQMNALWWRLQKAE